MTHSIEGFAEIHSNDDNIRVGDKHLSDCMKQWYQCINAAVVEPEGRHAYWSAIAGITADVLRANIDRVFKVSAKLSRSRERSLRTIMHGEIGQWMPYNFVADSIHTKKLCSRLSSEKMHFLTETDMLRFEPLFKGSGQRTLFVLDWTSY